jgi:hypothetical protein
MAESAQSKAKDEPTPKEAAREAAKEAEPKEDAEAFPVERLTGPDAQALTGYEPHEVAGALSAINKKNLTVEEAKKATKAWLGSEVKEG